jgi:hypothetical protein
MTDELKIKVTHQPGKAPRKISAAVNDSDLEDIPIDESREFSFNSPDQFLKIPINGDEKDKDHWFVKLSHSPAIAMNLKSEYTDKGWTLIVKKEAGAGAATPPRAETVNVTIGDDKTGRPD